MAARALSALVALAIVGGALTGCMPDAEPEPTAPFATEAEAFAAAEATYRAYVDALNQVDLADPETFEAVYAWTTGDANANERQTLSEMHSDGWTVSGTTRVQAFRGEGVSGSSDVTAIACTDVSDVSVVDADGNSVVPTTRPDYYALELNLVGSSSSSTGLLITSSNAIEDDTCP